MRKAKPASSAEGFKDNRICCVCIREKYLSDFAQKQGKRRKCSYCSITGKTISVDELADRIQTVIEQFYERTAENPDGFQSAMMADKESDYSWERAGDPIAYIIEDLADIPAEAAIDVQKLLQERFSSRSAEEMGQESEFDEDAQYEYIGISSNAWEERWNEFEQSLKTNSRYFNQLGKVYLDEVFRDIERLRTIGGSAIKLVGPDQNLTTVYRARVFLSNEALRAALTNIVDQLGPPPSYLAKSGRMNATGISVFYGSTDEHTALAEVRPPVGSRVAVAKFAFLRELRLLNLIDIRNIKVKGSLFNQVYADLLSRVQFLNQLCKKMTIPVMPGEEDMQYLATQAIADYLSTDCAFDLDGIIFPSIQTNEGSNIVLFYKSSKVKQREIPPGTEISVQLSDYDGEDTYPSFKIWEETPHSPVSHPTESNDPRKQSLEIVETDIRIHQVKSVQYNSEPHEVYIQRHEKTDFEEIQKQLWPDGNWE